MQQLLQRLDLEQSCCSGAASRPQAVTQACELSAQTSKPQPAQASMVTVAQLVMHEGGFASSSSRALGHLQHRHQSTFSPFGTNSVNATIGPGKGGLLLVISRGQLIYKTHG